MDWKFALLKNSPPFIIHIKRKTPNMTKTRMMDSEYFRYKRRPPVLFYFHKDSLFLTLLATVDAETDTDNHHQADDDVVPKRWDAHQGHAVAQNSDQGDPQDGAKDSSRTSRQAGATQDNGGDHGQLL